MRQWKALGALLVAVLAVGIIGIALGLRSTEPIQSTTVSQSSTSELIKSTSTISTSMESVATNTTSATRGLQLFLSIEPDNVVTGGNVTVYLSVLNLLSVPQNFSVASFEPLAFLNLYKGYMVESNLTLTQDILATSNPDVPSCTCPAAFETYILLGPHQATNQTFDWGGTWTRSGDQYAFTPFQKGVYTIEAFVPSASMFVLAYFVVTEPPPA